MVMGSIMSSKGIFVELPLSEFSLFAVYCWAFRFPRLMFLVVELIRLFLLPLLDPQK